jgi:hypothetical protein
LLIWKLAPQAESLHFIHFQIFITCEVIEAIQARDKVTKGSDHKGLEENKKY